jgi:hypothetical protein
VALGWLGWSPELAMTADLNAIELAYLGRLDMLKAIFGSGDTASKDQYDKLELPTGEVLDARGNEIVLTPQIFDLMFGGGKAGSNKRKLMKPKTFDDDE